MYSNFILEQLLKDSLPSNDLFHFQLFCNSRQNEAKGNHVRVSGPTGPSIISYYTGVCKTDSNRVCVFYLVQHMSANNIIVLILIILKNCITKGRKAGPSHHIKLNRTTLNNNTNVQHSFNIAII